ncbi:MAG: hypothetical protein HGJ94_13990 [Desulfosarcina sp.]|nr:hypothetical protein [Desulfosarcina sp.]MBC2741558.1 hypothetical protein [Desulfosarcina sp.]MBC2764472.1 hypothetical protein [Desulfosarcina sp.]
MGRSRTGKIAQYHLEETISKMAYDDGMTGKEISVRLIEMGYKVSHPTVCRWLKKQVEHARTQSEKIFTDHVAEHLPKDLDALEAMEALCLTWANESGADRVQRLSSWKQVTQLIPAYAARLIAFTTLETKEKNAEVKAFIRELMAILVEDINLVRQRLAAIGQGTKIIETKLKNAGLISDADKGNVVIKGYDDAGGAAGPEPPTAPETQRRLLAFKGGRD